MHLVPGAGRTRGRRYISPGGVPVSPFNPMDISDIISRPARWTLSHWEPYAGYRIRRRRRARQRGRARGGAVAPRTRWPPRRPPQPPPPKWHWSARGRTAAGNRLDRHARRTRLSARRCRGPRRVRAARSGCPQLLPDEADQRPHRNRAASDCAPDAERRAAPFRRHSRRQQGHGERHD